MARLSDQIEALLKEMIEANQGVIEITRGELAEKVSCVPSQITYVLSKRFTYGQGYQVESRRGGGGWIRIQRVRHKDSLSSQFMHILNSIDGILTQQEVEIFLKNFVSFNLLDEKTAKLIYAATCDNTLICLIPSVRDGIRTDIFKKMILQVVLNNEEK